MLTTAWRKEPRTFPVWGLSVSVLVEPAKDAQTRLISLDGKALEIDPCGKDGRGRLSEDVEREFEAAH